MTTAICFGELVNLHRFGFEAGRVKVVLLGGEPRIAKIAYIFVLS